MTPQTTHPLLPPLGAALPEHPEVFDSLVYQLNGLVVVFVALGLIWGLLETVGVFFRERPAAPVRQEAPAVPGATTVPAETVAISPELAAAIAAAVFVSVDAGDRITSIVPVDPPAHDWALEGRRIIHSARKVR